MEAQNSSSKNINRVVVVGGGSRAAVAFRQLVARTRPFALTVLVRQPIQPLPRERVVVVKDYFSPPEEVFTQADAVINFVGILENQSESELLRVNVRGPERLAQIARACSVKRMVQLSSLHVYGTPARIDTSTDEMPLSPYARSKLAGDVALTALGTHDFRITLLRMPMHYGPNAGAKLRMLVLIASRLGWFPVPKTSVQRSMVHLDNLAIGIVTVIRRGLDGIQFTADPEPFCYEILRDALRLHLGKTIHLIQLPDFLFLPLRLFARGVYQRLYRDNVIASELVLQPEGGYPVAMIAGLKDVMP